MASASDSASAREGWSSPFAPTQVACLLLLTFCGACGRVPDPGPELACRELQWDHRPRRASVVLLLSDTNRRDRMGAYGGPAATPAFDAFAARNLLFDRAVSQAPWTKPSMASLFTSLYPSQHGLLSHPILRQAKSRARAEEQIQADVLPAGLVTLAEVLRSAGHQTAAFVANPWLRRDLGFEQGFQL